MSQRSVRFPDDLEQKIQAKADKLDRSFSWVVLAACSVAVEGELVAQGRAVMQGAKRTYAARTPPGGAGKSRDELALERQRKMNEAKS